MRILLVMHDRAGGEAIVRSLLVLGHEAALAGSPESALLRLRTEPPDVLIAEMPGAGAPDFLRLLPVRTVGVPTIAIAGALATRDHLPSGAVDLLKPPVRPEDLQAALVRLQARIPAPPLGDERRRSPRVTVVVPVILIDSGGAERPARSLDLGTYGIKLWSPVPLDDVTASELIFTPPDGGGPMRVLAVRVREDQSGHAFAFVDLTEDQVFRLAGVVRRLSS